MDYMTTILEDKIFNAVIDESHIDLMAASTYLSYKLDEVLKRVLSLNDYERLIKELKEETW